MKRSAIPLAISLAFFLCFTQFVAGWTDPDSPAEASQRAASEPTVREGGKDDIDAIGSRDIGGRGLGNWYSLATEIKIGKQYAQEIDSTVKLLRDPVANEYVNRIGENLVRNSDAQVPFTIKVIDGSEVNAFALPGGFLYVNSGVILMADEEAELAGVMAHEIAHVAARHTMRQMTRFYWANIASIPLIFVGGGVGYAARSAAGLGLPVTFLKFSRGFEEEADYLGLQYMFKAGYDPQSFMSFFEKIQAKEKIKPGTMSRIFASHPRIENRIAKTQKQIDTKLPSRPQYIVTTAEFDDVRTRLAVLENRNRTPAEQKESKPTLRRAPKSAEDAEAEDDRPTLKRRGEER